MGSTCKLFLFLSLRERKTTCDQSCPIKQNHALHTLHRDRTQKREFHIHMVPPRNLGRQSQGSTEKLGKNILEYSQKLKNNFHLKGCVCIQECRNGMFRAAWPFTFLPLITPFVITCDWGRPTPDPYWGRSPPVLRTIPPADPLYCLMPPAPSHPLDP